MATQSPQPANPFVVIFPYALFACVLSAVFLGFVQYVPVTMLSTRLDPLSHREVRVPNARVPWPEQTESAMRGVAVLEIHEGGATAAEVSTAAGFLVSDGLVTCYHNIRNAKKIFATFPGESRYELTHLWAVDEGLDLALLYVDLPPRISALALSPRLPSPQSDVVAIGHGKGGVYTTVRGHVNAVRATTELPSNAQVFLMENLGRTNPVWIQHDIPTSLGFSGGPLIDEFGEVVGINCMVDKPLQLGYAIAAEHVPQLSAQAYGEPITLDDYRRRRSLTAAVQSIDEPVARLSDLTKEITANEYRQDHQRLYRDLQLFAALTARVTPMAMGQTAEQRRELITQVAGVANSLHRPSGEQFNVLNELAAANVMRGEQGFVWVGKVNDVFRNRFKDELAVFTDLEGIEGFNLLASIPLESMPPEVGQSYLFFGVITGQSLSFGANPFEQQSARVVSCHGWEKVTPLQKAADEETDAASEAATEASASQAATGRPTESASKSENSDVSEPAPDKVSGAVEASDTAPASGSELAAPATPQPAASN